MKTNISILIVLGILIFVAGYFVGQLSYQQVESSNIFNATSNNYNSLLANLDKKCSLKPEGGPCKANFRRYYFASEERLCKSFTWGGCEGIVPFETLEDCRALCEIPSRTSFVP